jgi:hypothetical protein
MLLARMSRRTSLLHVMSADSTQYCPHSSDLHPHRAGQSTVTVPSALFSVMVT